jgi:hypothetical protein
MKRFSPYALREKQGRTCTVKAQLWEKRKMQAPFFLQNNKKFAKITQK